jgi:hypothetical protein
MENDQRQKFLDELRSQFETNVGLAADYLAFRLRERIPRSRVVRKKGAPWRLGHVADKIKVEHSGLVAHVIVPYPWAHVEFGTQDIQANPIVRNTAIGEADHIQMIVESGL